MSIIHKAYLFQHEAFQKELADVLFAALRDESVEGLRQFIDEQRQHLTDQETEGPLGEDWEAGADKSWDSWAAVQCYADIALTKYYDLTDDRGLAYGWDALAAYFGLVPLLHDSADLVIGGYLFGPKGRRLDPGSMGTGLLSTEDVTRLLKLLEWPHRPPIPGPESEVYAGCYYKPDSVGAVQLSLDELLELYRAAKRNKCGLLLTDYNDRGVSRL
jgi:hypothetical protein